MNSELEENRELAENRLSELQRLQQDLQNVDQENNNMKVCVCVCQIQKFCVCVCVCVCVGRETVTRTWAMFMEIVNKMTEYSSSS